MFDCSTGVVESRAESESTADGEGVIAGRGAAVADDSAAGFSGDGAGIAGEMATAGAAASTGKDAGFAANDVVETGFSAPSAGAGAIEMLAPVFRPAAAVTEFDDPEAEADETFE